MLHRAVARGITCRRATQNLKTSSSSSSTRLSILYIISAKNVVSSSAATLFSQQMPTRSYTVSASADSSAQTKKSRPSRPLEFFRDVNVEEERRILEADLPKYDEAQILAARTESDDYKRRGKTPPAALSKKIMYSYYAAGDYARAHLAFLDLNAKQQPSLFDFNLVFLYQTIAKDFGKIHETFDIMRKHGIVPNLLTMQVLFKAFGVSGSVGRILYIYQLMFQQGLIPDKSQLEDVLKSAAVAGDPTTFSRFFSRLQHKGTPVEKDHLNALMLMWKTSGNTNDQYVARMRPNINDFTCCIEYALRVHNYRLAFDLVRECRDQYDIQPDAFMYETVLSALIRDNILRTDAYSWRKRFTEYARTITRREDHFEFSSFLTQVEEYIVKELCAGEPSLLKTVPIRKPEPRVRVQRTTRKMSRQLYKSYPRTRYATPYDESDDLLEWVPDYKKRRELEPVKKAIELSTATLRAIQEAAHARVAAQKAQAPSQ